MTGNAIDIALLGDLILGEPDPDLFFEPTRAVLRAKDLVIGHLEVPHTTSRDERAFDVPAEPSDPDRLPALHRAGVQIATLAGNHVYDFGPQGITDTLRALEAAGVASCGAGRDLAAAERPARVERRGVRVGVLSYNCVGPRESWAREDKAGCAYVRVLRSDGSDELGPGAATQLDSAPDAASLAHMQRRIGELAGQVDVVIVALHKGIVHTPALLAGYERPLARAAIEAGAHIVVSHHAHILRGIELIEGRPVFHGLGNFVTVTRALSEDNPHPARQAWARKRRELFGFTPDPDYPTYPFHPEAKHALIADCRVDRQGRVDTGFLPCWVRPNGAPELHGRDARGQAVFDYVAEISRRAGLSVELAWDGDRVLVR
ncbi:MAG TPA: CapA family protein [Polyangiales bacterium]|nr:CapA family protein [Polyangiales bacterium]